MKIADREIGPGHPVYIIAEAGLAHLGSFDLAMEMLHAAKEAGADAFKTQFWKVEDSFKLYSGSRKPYRCLRLASLYRLADECAKIGIHFLCTPHDEYALEIVAKTCPAIKIGSGEKRNWEFIVKAGSYGLPLIVSCGGYIDHDYLNLGTAIKVEHNFLLFCISKYPTTWEDVKGQMPDFRNSIYDGWSSHTGYEDRAIDYAVAAAGAKIIEKHIKPDLVQEPESSMDMKVSISIKGFSEWCKSIRGMSELFP